MCCCCYLVAVWKVKLISGLIYIRDHDDEDGRHGQMMLLSSSEVGKGDDDEGEVKGFVVTG